MSNACRDCDVSVTNPLPYEEFMEIAKKQGYFYLIEEDIGSINEKWVPVEGVNLFSDEDGANTALSHYPKHDLPLRVTRVDFPKKNLFERLKLTRNRGL